MSAPSEILSITLPLWADLHAHFRQGEVLPHLLNDHARMGCYAILAMPNTRPPVSKALESQQAEGWSIEGYHKNITDAGGKVFEHIIVPLYLSRETTPQMIEEGVKSGWLKAAKYYPPHGTTNSDHGIAIDELLKGDVIKALEDNGVILCIHGEKHQIKGEEWFGQRSNAEVAFYRESMPKLLEQFPKLKVVCEHITTRAAVELVKQSSANVAATVTPQHLLYTVGDMLQGWFAHMRCMPLLKFEEDMQALRDAVTAKTNTKFFAGTDSAPHPRHAKAMECGCAAGCYSGGVAPQLYAMAFEQAGLDMANAEVQEVFKRFLCDIGPDFYGFARSERSFTLKKQTQEVLPLQVSTGDIMPLPAGITQDGKATLPWSVEVHKH